MNNQQTFPKTLRLLTSEQFKRVFAKPTKFHSKTFSVFALENELEHPRLGLAIPKKAVRKAVERNRIKRILRESFRCQRMNLSPRDFVIIARSGMADLTNQQLFSLISKAWVKFGYDTKNR